jgi:phosphate-selective porin OprO/OprP
MLSSEYVGAWVDSPETGDPRFWGFYVVGSYVLTGEHRPYDRNVGYARRVMPQGKRGAWEVVARYSHVDIDDQQIDGGILDMGFFGLNWWATRRWKFGVGYGLSQLDRFGTSGITHTVTTRIQWIY